MESLPFPDGARRRPHHSLRRRDFIRLAGLGTLGAVVLRDAMAGALAPADFASLVPGEKNLDPAWVNSLFARGEPTVLRGDDLKFVGLPVSGITTGQLYLGGDGRLWQWDIFNHFVYTDSEHYAHPPLPKTPLVQGFSLQLGDRVIPLDRTGFSDVSFRGEYPIGLVHYADPAVPVTVALEAYSPFTPLSLDDSSLPATVMAFTLTNPTGRELEVAVLGELENAICRFSPATSIRRVNRFAAGEAFTFLECRGEEVAGGKASETVWEDWSQPAGANSAGGKFTSPPFCVTAPFINFEIGGPPQPSLVEVKLLQEGRLVRLTRSRSGEKRRADGFDVADLIGQMVQFEVTALSGSQPPSAGVGPITFSDRPWRTQALTELPDFGTMGLALLGPAAEIKEEAMPGRKDGKLVGRLGRKLTLAPGATATVMFVVAWSFPNLWLTRQGRVGRHYATRFPTAESAARYVAGNFPRLSAQTRKWRDTWYDSTLPYWFLDRTMANTSTLATSTSLRFADGRFWAWEGVGNCAGTCTHVWGYGQALGRLFPAVEQMLREQVDYDSAMSADGRIGFRGGRPAKPEPGNWAVDGQSMIVLRTLRQHQVSPDNRFLRGVWPQAKRALEALIAMDPGEAGILQGPQHNTLDAEWYGRIAWLSGLYQAALRAGEEMAREVGDDAFASCCRRIFLRGQASLTADLFDGDYFINRVDPTHLDAINSGTGCHIDQVMGQGWAFQVGLGRITPEKETRRALASLWRYNFAPDVGAYRKVHSSGRWLAMPGEAGLLMCTFPRSDWDFAQAAGTNARPGFAGYLNECMNGFEYQVAGHMIWEDMVLEGMALTRTVHDRYAASRRNPWNEVEWGDHYARSMASYGVFLAACGFEYHGPRGRLGFSPRLGREEFRAAFTATEGWGTFEQKIASGKLRVAVEVKWGKLSLAELRLHSVTPVTKVSAAHSSRPIPATLKQEGGTCVITLGQPVILSADESLTVELT